MPNIKPITATTTTGSTVYGMVERVSDGYLLNDADGAFASAPADPYVSLTEHSTLKGFYRVNESRTTWNDGFYNVFVYRQAGGSPSPVADTMVKMTEESVGTDVFITMSTLDTSSDLLLTRLSSSRAGYLDYLQYFNFITGAIVTDTYNSSIQFKTDLTNANNDAMNGGWVKFTSGSLSGLPPKRISSYNGTTKYIYLTSGFYVTPSVGDAFIIITA